MMNSVRGFVYSVLGWMLTVIYGLLATILWVFPRSIGQRIIISWNITVLAMARWICGVKYELSGFDYNPKNTDPKTQKNENYVIVSNHQSAWETIFIQSYFFPVSSVLKKQLLDIPFFGWGLKVMNPIGIDRSKPAQALKQVKTGGIERLQSGYNLMIFPEGTRRPVGELGDFKRSAADIAKSAGVKILPIYHNAGVFWKDKEFKKIPGTISVVMGEPIDVADKNTKEVMADIREWMQAQSDRQA